MRNVTCVAAVLGAGILATACTTRQRSPTHVAVPVPLNTAETGIALQGELLGKYTWPIATRSKVAQAYFDQGLRLMYSFARDEARQSFEKARTIDALCAMCWWGEAWTMGPYLNGAMAPVDAPLAYAAAQRAEALASSSTPVERAVIKALTARYAPTPSPEGRNVLDSAYADAMQAVHVRYPRHQDVATLYADALMVLEPRRGIWPMTKPSIPQIHAILEGVLARNPAHPGACHSYIHATETTPQVGEAQRCADLFGAAVPGVSHVNHMPSHTYNRVGRWGDATQANITAVATDRAAGSGRGYAIYPAHNLHMLLFSAAVDGQERVAIEAANDHAAMAGPDGVVFQAITLVRFGRFENVLELTTAPSHPIGTGVWAFSRGLAHLRRGSSDSAAAYLKRVDSLARHTPRTRLFRVHEPAKLLGVLSNILQGELLRSAGRSDSAIAVFRTAVAREQTLTYDEPEPLPFTSYDFLGAALLDMGRAAEAAEVYRTALLSRPNNGWSLFGLERALRSAGRVTDANAARARFQRAWVRSAVRLQSSRF